MIVILPHLTHLWLLLLIHFGIGLGFGSLMTGQSAFLSTLWGKKTLRLRIIDSLARGLCSAVAPLMIQVFARPLDPYSAPTLQIHESKCQYFLSWPYFLVASFAFVSSVTSFVVWKFYPVTTAHNSRGQDQHESQGEGTGSNVISSFWKRIMIVFALFFILSIYPIDHAVTAFIAPFVRMISLPQQTGNQMISALFASQTISRITGIIYIPYIGLEINFILTSIMLISANAILVLSGGKNEAALWIGVVLVGFSTANDVNLIYCFMERYFSVTNGIAAAAVAMAMIGNGMFPLLVAPLMERDPSYLFMITSAFSASSVVMLVIIVLIGRLWLIKEQGIRSRVIESLDSQVERTESVSE